MWRYQKFLANNFSDAGSGIFFNIKIFRYQFWYHPKIPGNSPVLVLNFYGADTVYQYFFQYQMGAIFFCKMVTRVHYHFINIISNIYWYPWSILRIPLLFAIMNIMTTQIRQCWALIYSRDICTAGSLLHPRQAKNKASHNFLLNAHQLLIIWPRDSQQVHV